MSPFSRQSGHIRKKIFVMSHVNIIIGHFYHLYVYMSHLAVSEGLFLSSFCLYVPCSCHSRTFLPFSRLYVPLLYAPGYFSTFILYMSRLILSAGFLCRTEMFRKGKSVYLLVSITKNPGNTQLNVLPPPSSFVFRHHPQSVFLSHPYDNFSS